MSKRKPGLPSKGPGKPAAPKKPAPPRPRSTIPVKDEWLEPDPDPTPVPQAPPVPVIEPPARPLPPRPRGLPS